MSIDLIDSGDIQDIQSASAAARELNSALEAATNKNTGKLDLSLFQKSISKSGNDLNDLISRLSLAGNAGSKAFQQLARSVTNAQMPIKQTSKLMSDFATTMKNTIKWQLSSNLVHGLQSGLEGAISYAKNLNSSLTDIRIVTGASADEMARFAKQANNAAKQLSTSTLDYTKASLIYYQQGDSEADVKKKAEITLKAANSSFNTSTQEMSEYLTAVWNSYQVGADELERYVDIMAALGAKTATSLEEIATSMQKVAATGNTVGVSMEQVSSIIATVSSVTRESAESIGTSYKTIFARMGDLKLGKTDEDGIGLGQVSSSLEKIGVSVLDATGDLREMGDIITDLGNKWQTMTSAEKTAIAQVVAGKRQYTQLMALFENWDMYNQNLDIAANSEGALQEMQDIYAESWDAASKRVKASLESVYGAVINDQAIIKITNGIADLIDKVYSLVEAFGGVETAIGLIGSIFLKTMKPQITEGIGGFINNLKISSGVAQQEFVKNQKNIMDEMMNNASLSGANSQILGYYDKLRDVQSKIVLSGKTYSQEEIAQIESTINKIREKINVQTQLIELQRNRSQDAAGAASYLADTFVQSVAEDSLSDDQTWEDLSYSKQQEKLREIRSVGPDDDGSFIDVRSAEIQKLNFALQQLSNEEISVDIELDTENEIVSLQDLQKAGVQSANDIINAYRMVNKVIGKVMAAEGQLTNIKRQITKNDIKEEDGTVKKVTTPEETKEAAKKFISTVKNLGLDDSIKNELLSGVEEALKDVDNGAAGAVDKLRQTLEKGVEQTEQKINEIRQNANMASFYTENVMGDNVSEQDKKNVRKTARAEGMGEQAGQPQSPEDFGKEINTDFTMATESAEQLANKFSNLLEGAVSLGTGLSMVSNGITNLINGSATLGESFISIASGIAMVTSGVGNFLNGLSGLGDMYKEVNGYLSQYLKNIKNTIASEGGLIAAIKAKITGKSTETVVTKQLAKAEYEQAAAQQAVNASNPLGWILLATAAIVALTAAVSARIKALKEERAEASETAEKELEAIQQRQEENKKELDEIQKTYNAYSELKEQYKDTGENREDYESATQALLKALDLEALSVEATKGKYEELAETIEYANQKRRDEIRLSAESDLAQIVGYNKTWFEGLDDRKDHDSKILGNTEIRDERNRQYYNSQTNQFEDYNGGTYRFGWALQHLKDSSLVGDGTGSVWSSSSDMHNTLIDLGFLANKNGKIIDEDDLDLSSDPIQLMRTYENMLAFEAAHEALRGNDQWNFIMSTVASMAEPEIAARLNLGSINAEDKQEEWQSYDDWVANQAEGTDTSKDAYFAAMEADVMESFTSLGLDPARAQSSVDTIIQSWVQGLSLDSEYADYQARSAKKELYETDRWGAERLSNDEAMDQYNENNSAITLLEEAIAAKKANPNSAETKALIQDLISKGIITDENANLEVVLAEREEDVEGLTDEINRTNTESANSVRADLLSIAGDGYTYEKEPGDILLNDTNLIKFVTDKLEKLGTSFDDFLQNENYWDGDDLTKYGRSPMSSLTGQMVSALWGDELRAIEDPQERERFLEEKLAEIDVYTKQSLGLSDGASLTDRQKAEGYWRYMSAQTTSAKQAGSLLAESYSPFEHQAEKQTKVSSEKFGEIIAEDVIRDFTSFDSLDRQDDIWKLSEEDFGAFVERLGGKYLNKTKEDFAAMSADEWEEMLLHAGRTIIPLMEALKTEGLLTTDQISAVVEASAETANKAHEAAQSAWEKIISLTQEESDKQWALMEKRDANTKAAEALENGQAYDDLDPWTKMWLQEQYGQAAEQNGAEDVGSYIESQGGADFLLAMNESLMASQGQLYEDVFLLTKSIVDASLQEGAYNAESGKYVISIDDIEFADDDQKAQFLQDHAGELTEDGSKIEIDTEQMSQFRASAEEAAGYLDLAQQGENIRFEALANSADITVSELKDYAETIMQINGDTREFNELSYDEQEHLLNVAAAAKKAEQGWEELNSSYEENIKTLKESDKTSTKYTNSLQSMTKSMKKIFNDSKSVTEDFVESHLDDIEKMAEGDEEAFERIQDELLKLDLGDLYNFDVGVDIDGDGATEQLGTLIDNWEDMLANEPIGTTVDINTGPATAALLELVNAGDATSSAIMAALNSIGWQPQVEYVAADLGEYSDGHGNVTVPVISYDEFGLPYISGWTTEPITSEMEASSSVLIPKIGSGPVAAGGGVGQKVNISGFTKTSPGRTGGGGKSSGSGGGGGSKSKEKKDYKRFEDEVERYHVQNENLERIGEELSRIDKLKDRTYGKDHVAQLDAETDALRRQYDAQVDLYNEAMKWKAADQAELISLGVGVQFDENGNISNYEDVMQGIIDKYNAAVDVYNNSEQGDGDKLRLEDAEEAYEDAKTAVENYEEAVEIANQAQIDMQDILNQLSELALEKITYELELDLEVNERDIELLEYFQEKYSEVLDKQDDVFSSLMQTASEYQSNLSELNQAYTDLVAQYDNGNGTLLEAQYAEGLADLSDQILDNLSSLKDLEEEIAETYANTLELARDEIDKTLGSLEHFNSAMQSYITIAGLSGKAFFQLNGEMVSNSFKGLETFYDAQFENNMNRILIQREHLDVLLEEETRFRDKIESGQQLTDLEKEQYAALQEQIQETREGVLSATEETLETLQEGYENTINGIAEDLDKFMAGSAGSLAHLADQYAYFQEEQERYVSTARELYEISSLTRDIEGSIADASSKASKEALKALQEKIEKQSELNELTEYDIQMNQLQYQLLLARIQLEEAQNAKDTVRLTRDDNGNYAYQYTADQGKVDEALQNYEDVLQQINDLTTQRTSEIEQQMIDAMQSYKDQFQEIALDQTLTAEQRNERLMELNNRFSETMTYLQEQNGIVTENLTYNQEAIAEHYGVNMAEITASTAGNVNETVQSMIDKTEEYIAAMNAAIFGEDGASSAWQEYAARIGLVNAASGTSYQDMINNTEEMGDMNQYATEEALNTIQTLEQTLEPLGDLTEAWNEHNSVLQNTISYYEQLANAINQTMATIGETDTEGGIVLPSEQNNTVASNRGGRMLEYEEAVQALSEAQVETLEELTDSFPYLDKDLVGYNRSEGLYAAYNTILQEIDRRAVMQNISPYSAGSVSNQNGQEILQEVSIHADFPNATDQNEIIEAFETLINKAAQFASRKKY